MLKFSVILTVYNCEKYLKECLDSLINQTFKDFEIICINDGSTDNSVNILEDYAKRDNRIQIHNQENQGVGASRNRGIELAQGEYIQFLDGDDKLASNALESVNKFLKGNDVNIVSIPIYYFNERNHDLNYKFNRMQDSKNRIVDLNENPNAIQGSVNSAFIKKSAIANIRFDEKLDFDEGLIFINKILLLNNKIGLVKDTEYFYRRSNSKSLTNTAKNKKTFYTYRLDCLKDLIDYSIEKHGKLLKYIENTIAYSFKSFNNLSDFPNILTKEDIDEFWQKLYDILDYIDEDSLTNPQIMTKKIAYLGEFLVFIKNRMDFHVGKDEEGFTCLKTGNYIINNLEKRRIFFDIIELKKGVLNLSGNFVSSCKKEALHIEAIKVHNGKKEKFIGKEVEYPRTARETKRLLGIDWRFDYNFEFKIPIDKKGETKINFNMVYEEDGKKLVMKNNVTFRKFAEISKFSHYYIRNSQILAVINKTFHIMPYSLKKALRFELSSIKTILTNRTKYRYSSIFYRLLYLLCLPKMKNRKIYLFMDRRDNTGDNGEHLFRYAIEQNDDVEKYFAVEKDCKEYPKLKKEYGKSILEFGSFRHKFHYMFCDKLISSQGYKNHINPFADKNLKLVQGISSPPVYFLQHGVGKYNMTSWLRKYDINFSLLLTVSDLDQKAFVENYNYDEEIIQELGFPRFDNLTNENLKKEIVIIPTWRKEIRTEDDLISSEYFQRWNNLLNNERLLKSARENGYKIVYKPHPNSLKFLNLFNTENVEVDNKRRFHDILCESALMITDYSSVNFDFAYLKKPVIYYQYGDDYHFQGDSLIDDEASTFGAVIKKEDELIEKTIDYIENDCKMEEEYVEKVEKFFKYTDKGNCKRVYDWILKN